MAEDKVKEFEPVNCPECKRFLFNEAIFMGKVSVNCPQCKAEVIFERTPDFEDNEARIKIKRRRKK